MRHQTPADLPLVNATPGDGELLEDSLIRAESLVSDMVLIEGPRTNLEALSRLANMIREYGAKVERDPVSLKLLASLYEKRVLPKEAFSKGMNWRQSVALGLLAAAHLCDLDRNAIRLRDEGHAFVEDRLAIAHR